MEQSQKARVDAVWQLFCILFSIVIFTLILANRSPNLLRPLSMSLRAGFGLVIPATTLAVFLAFRVPGRLGEFTAMTVTLGLFALPLAGLWASGATQTTVLNGIIPMADAAEYYMDALRLIGGDKFSMFSARRPLFPGLLATVLFLTERNLMVALAVLTGITAFACYFTAREIQRTHGAVTASFILMILFLFYRAHSGVSMSENLGVALGALGFGFLWRGAAHKDLTYIWIGLFTTTLALNARAGAFFMLPILILWAGRMFRENSLLSWKAVLITTSAVIFAFALNFSFTRLIAVPAGVPFANFSYTLYGLASGGNSWIYVFESHPELLAIPEPEQTLQIYKLAFDLIRANPLLLIKGALFNWSMLFSNSWYNVYAYVGGENWNVNVAASWVMYILALTGLFAWYKDRQNPVNSLIAVATLGVFISVPFLPPTDTYRMRSYAASIIVLAALPALGLDFIVRKSKVKFFEASREQVSSVPFLPVAFNFILIAMTIVAPLFILWNAKPVTLNAFACSSADSAKVLIRFDEGTYINLKKQNQSFLDWMPDYHIGLFRKNLHSIPSDTMNWAAVLEPPATLFLAMAFPDKGSIWVILKTDMLPTPGKYYQICGKQETEAAYLVGSKTFFYVDEILPLTP